MKLIAAVITPVRFDEVYSALEAIGVAGITATEVQGVRREKNSTEVYRGAAYSVSFRSKIKIEVAVTDEQLDSVVAIIASAGNGDGSVFVTSLEQAIPMRKRESLAGAA